MHNNCSENVNQPPFTFFSRASNPASARRISTAPKQDNFGFNTTEVVRLGYTLGYPGFLNFSECTVPQGTQDNMDSRKYAAPIAGYAGIGRRPETLNLYTDLTEGNDQQNGQSSTVQCAPSQPPFCSTASPLTVLPTSYRHGRYTTLCLCVCVRPCVCSRAPFEMDNHVQKRESCFSSEHGVEASLESMDSRCPPAWSAILS